MSFTIQRAGLAASVRTQSLCFTCTFASGASALTASGETSEQQPVFACVSSLPDLCLVALAGPVRSSRRPAGVSRRSGRGCSYAGRARRQDHSSNHAGADGPGSFMEALDADGPAHRRVRSRRRHRLRETRDQDHQPYLTIAGQTAPSPGITLIRTGIDLLTHDVVMQHIRVRTGSAGADNKSGWAPDAFSPVNAHNVIVDHCSLTWAIDENLSASGPALHRQDA